VVLKRLIFYSIIIVAVILPLNPAFSQTSKDILEIKERLVRLEEDRKTLSLRIDELDKRLITGSSKCLTP
jgi:regulator of replication initiation timing